MFNWEPPEFRLIKDDEVVCYAFAIANFPIILDKKVKKFMKYIEGLDGFQGFYPHYPHGTLLIFNTENNAKAARNLVRNYRGYTGGVGDNIGEVYINKKYLRG